MLHILAQVLKSGATAPLPPPLNISGIPPKKKNFFPSHPTPQGDITSVARDETEMLRLPPFTEREGDAARHRIRMTKHPPPFSSFGQTMAMADKQGKKRCCGGMAKVRNIPTFSPTGSGIGGSKKKACQDGGILRGCKKKTDRKKRGGGGGGGGGGYPTLVGTGGRRGGGRDDAIYGKLRDVVR